ncbi:MAG: hypothetical protein LN415_02060 [Candidatus Thermoplasmatota archaeon]|nr:hypothetical protein [Candidatus Thermoplasmatota archaeon]
MIVDSSVLIHLSRIGELSLLKEFLGKVTITEDVYRETVEESAGRAGSSAIEQACGDWIDVREPKDKKVLDSIVGLEGIERADASLILMAEEKGDALISNDLALIRVARSRGVESWWLTTLILKMTAKGKMSKEEAKAVLIELVETGLRLSPEVYTSVLGRIDEM